MAVVYGAIANVPYGSRTNTTIAKPTVSVGDTLFGVYIGTGGTDTVAETVSPPSGWTEFTATAFTTFNAFGLSMRARLYARLVDGSEGASITWTHVTKSTAGAILAFAGVHTTAPYGSMGQSNGTGGTSTYPTITPTAGGGILAVGLDFGDTVNNLVPPSGTPTLTERLDSVVLYISTADNVAGSATGSRTQTNNSTGSSPWWAMQIALEPAAGGAPAAIASKKLIIQRQALVRASYW